MLFLKSDPYVILHPYTGHFCNYKKGSLQLNSWSIITGTNQLFPCLKALNTLATHQLKLYNSISTAKSSSSHQYSRTRARTEHACTTMPFKRNRAAFSHRSAKAPGSAARCPCSPSALSISACSKPAAALAPTRFPFPPAARRDGFAPRFGNYVDERAQENKLK